MYNPSYDFKLLDMPNISPLQAQEFGILPTLRPSDPTGYVDFSLGQLGGLYNPSNAYPYPQTQFPADITPLVSPSFFQSPSDQPQTLDDLRKRLQKVRDDAQSKLDEIGGDSSDCPEGRNILGVCQKGKPVLKSDGNTGSGAGKLLSKAFGFDYSNIPQGAGIFLIAIVIIILLLLIARR